MADRRLWPENVGIIAIELYIPRQFVCQKELEAFDGVSEGKYTIGLGQEKMGFCTDREDVHSVCLTVTKNLLENYQIDPDRIGRLEVGTETIIDKSKSVKSVLMQLFEECANYSLEGADTTNACFGGTQALFNAANWIESSAWDGRFALVVMGDIAVYAKGPARCTGGAGAIALLVGPHAPLVFERGLRAVHVRHAYDFYKPDLTSEYPTVDGQLSVKSYLSAVDACYKGFCDKSAKFYGKEISLVDFEAVLFHSPYCKLVQKSLARLSFLDFRRNCGAGDMNGVINLHKYKEVNLEDTYMDKTLEKACVTYSKDLFEKKTRPSLLFAKNIGNMYTPSLYSCLSSFLLSRTIESLLGCRVLMFSYGSGLAAAMFSLRIRDSDREGLTKICNGLKEAKEKLLNQRVKVGPEQFTAALTLREELLGKAFVKRPFSHCRFKDQLCLSLFGHLVPYEPKGETDMDSLFEKTFYLTKIDEKYRRSYERFGATSTPDNDSVAMNGY